MIREYAPIALIPAAWIMTFSTMIYPGLDTYWIQHMHYFMILFLTGFTILSWKQMGQDVVLDVWRKVIAAGILFTGFGALSFISNTYSNLLAALSLGYWLLAPGIGCYLSAKEMTSYKEAYKGIGLSGIISTILVSTILFNGLDIVISLGFALAAISQTYSIIIAAKMDENL